MYTAKCTFARCKLSIILTAETVKVVFVEDEFTFTNQFQGQKAGTVTACSCLFNTILPSAMTERFARVQKQRTKPQGKSEVNAYCEGHYYRNVPNK